ncbi:MAG: hypothetical protein H5T74_04615 [Actinobacteria bacterium]|nr:hypothetical protein [Actinomycetota bacterium]
MLNDLGGGDDPELVHFLAVKNEQVILSGLDLLGGKPGDAFGSAVS